MTVANGGPARPRRDPDGHAPCGRDVSQGQLEPEEAARWRQHRRAPWQPRRQRDGDGDHHGDARVTGRLPQHRHRQGNEPDTDPSNNTATAMTSAAAPEECDNCVDDDQDGHVDYEVPACCPPMGTLTVTKVRVTPRNGNSSNAKLRITGTLTVAVSPPSIREPPTSRSAWPTAPACRRAARSRRSMDAALPQALRVLGSAPRIRPPVRDIQFAQKSRGGSGISITSLNFDLSQLQGPDLKITVHAGDPAPRAPSRCAGRRTGRRCSRRRGLSRCAGGADRPHDLIAAAVTSMLRSNVS